MERIQCSIAPKSPKVSKSPYSIMSASYLSIFSPLYLRSNTSRNTSITIKNTNSLNALQQHPEAWMRLGSLCKVLYKHIWEVISYRRIYKQHLQDWKHKAEVWERTINKEHHKTSLPAGRNRASLATTCAKAEPKRLFTEVKE